MRDAHRIKEKMEVSLDGRQIFFLLFGGALVASLVFVVGVMVGKRLEARQARVAHAPADELARVDEESREISAQLTFHDELVKPDPKARKDVPPEVLEWRDMGEADRAVAQVGGRSGPRADQRAQVVAVNDAARGTRGARGVRGARRSPRARSRRPHASRRFTLQVSAYKSRAEANQMVRKLRSEGYRPYVVAANVPRKGVWFRVRVGSFGSVSEASQAKVKFERQVNLPAYVSRR